MSYMTFTSIALKRCSECLSASSFMELAMFSKMSMFLDYEPSLVLSGLSSRLSWQFFDFLALVFIRSSLDKLGKERNTLEGGFDAVCSFELKR